MMMRMHAVGKKLRSWGLVALVWSVPYMATAAVCADGDTNCLGNPLRFVTLREFVEGALQVFVLLMLPVIAFFIVLSGLSFVMARGNPDKLKLAKWNFLFVIIGTCLMLGAWLLANLIGATVTQVTR